MSNNKVCVDIGSTYTKGAVFSLEDNTFILKRRAVVPTTVDFLPKGFYKILEQLNAADDEVFFSSSAKGGLKVAVVGLVPEMSLNIARLAAFSAGAKVCASYPYRLTRKHMLKIEKSKPDILLLCGGTDGGNERYANENSAVIGESRFEGTVLYAGNSYAADQVAENLSSKELVITENVMPDFGKLNIEPVRAAIRKIFLEKIVIGKGLDELINKFHTKPVPTPLAVLNLSKAIGTTIPGWGDFLLIDMGGATTDFYSYTKAFSPENNRVIKGIVEPTLKRTVEGDLGMRVSAESAFEVSKNYYAFMSPNTDLARFEEFVKYVHENPDYLPESEEEKELDRLMAEGCIYYGMMRHAGTVEEIFTCNGKVWAQTGKDLQRVTKIAGTGGYLAALGRSRTPLAIPSKPCKPTDKMPLLPQHFKYYSDTGYILPLLGSLAEKYPAEAASAAVQALTEIQEEP